MCSWTRILSVPLSAQFCLQAWADGNLAEAAGQDGGNIKVIPTLEHMGRPVLTGGVCPLDLLEPGVVTTEPIFLYMEYSLCSSDDLDEHTSNFIATSEIIRYSVLYNSGYSVNSVPVYDIAGICAYVYLALAFIMFVTVTFMSGNCKY